MTKKRFLFYIPLALFIVTFIVGSINNLDLTINKALYSSNNWFGLFMAAFGMVPGYGLLAFIGGMFITSSRKNQTLPLASKIIFYILSGAMMAVAIYYTGHEIISVNAFNCPSKWYIGYPLGLVLMVPFAIWGLYVGKNNNNPKLWVTLLILTIIAFIVLVPAVTLLKNIFHRPRFRYVVNGGLVDFHNWWQPCSEYKDYIGQVVNGVTITKEEFKSFPSGHTSCSALFILLMYYYPVFDPKAKKHQPWMFILGVIWTLAVAYSRMRIGAHYLTDVSMGGIIFMLFFIIGNEVLLAINKKHPLFELETENVETTANI